VLLKVHLRLAPIDNCGGVKKRIFNPGARWWARERAQHERVLAMVFFFPSMKKTWRSILDWRQILTDEKMIRLYKDIVQRELKMLREVLESVWMARHLGRGLRVEAHWSAAKIVSASL